MQKSVAVLIVSFGSLLFASCAYFRPLHGIPTQHIVMVDTHGRLMDPTGTDLCRPETIFEDNRRWVAAHGTAPPPSSYSWDPCNGALNPVRPIRGLERQEPDGYVMTDSELYLDDLFDAMDDHYKAKGSRERKLVFYVHGGLNNNATTIQRARDLTHLMLADDQYPIFLNWQSNLLGALYEHLMNVRQGDNKGNRHAYLLPFILGGDLAKGIARAPVTWFYQGSNSLDRVRQVDCNAKPWEFDHAYHRLRRKFLDACAANPNDCAEMAVSRGPETYTMYERLRETTRFAATGAVPTRYWTTAAGGGWASVVGWLPPKLLISPFLDGLGGPAWDTMLRRAAVGFHGDGVVNPPRFPAEKHPEGNGGFSRFFRRLQKKIADTDCRLKPGPDCIDWKVTIISHSMGTIVTNHILQEFPELRFDHIVYMAGAASVREYERAVFPYLRRHEQTKMYHLTLHNFADIRDQYFLELPPAGSLLVWIDSFLSKPETLRDRTVGRFNNLMMFAEETPQDLRRRISMKAFGVGGSIALDDPQSHGSFGLFDGRHRAGKFWDPKFWQVELQDRASPRAHCPRNKVP